MNETNKYHRLGYAKPTQMKMRPQKITICTVQNRNEK